MVPLLLAVLQSVAAPPPDIELHAIIEAETVRIEQHGRASLEVHADPDSGSLVKVDAPRANGAKTLRNVRVTVDAEARIGGRERASDGEPRPQATDAPHPR